MNEAKRRKVEYGDFQTPASLAGAVCSRLREMGINPDVVIEPTCGLGAFVNAAANAFPLASVHGYEINPTYLEELRASLATSSTVSRVHLHQADFFATDWGAEVCKHSGRVLVLGNLPWVTSAVLGSIGSGNRAGPGNLRNAIGGISAS